jgi:hypothetical protein
VSELRRVVSVSRRRAGRAELRRAIATVTVLSLTLPEIGRLGSIASARDGHSPASTRTLRPAGRVCVAGRRASARSGKRLLTSEEWESAAAGTPDPGPGGAWVPLGMQPLL